MNVHHIRDASTFKQTALLIDDQTTVLVIHRAILNSLNMNLNIVEMTDPIEALAWLQNKQIDLIITDFSMHKMNGMEFVQAIKSSHHVLTHALVVVTVIKDQATHQELIAAGAAACLTKPAQTQQLANIAKNLLEQSQQYYHFGLIN